MLKMIMNSNLKKVDVFYSIDTKPDSDKNIFTFKSERVSERVASGSVVQVSGVAVSEEKIIERVRKKLELHEDTSIDLIKVADPLVAACKNSNTAMVALQASRAAQLIRSANELGIPLHMTVNLLCRFKKVKMSEIELDAGTVNRNYVNQTLKGKHKPSTELRKKITELLGVDPWAI